MLDQLPIDTLFRVLRYVSPEVSSITGLVVSRHMEDVLYSEHNRAYLAAFCVSQAVDLDDQELQKRLTSPYSAKLCVPRLLRLITTSDNASDIPAVSQGGGFIRRVSVAASLASPTPNLSSLLLTARLNELTGNPQKAFGLYRWVLGFYRAGEEGRRGGGAGGAGEGSCQSQRSPPMVSQVLDVGERSFAVRAKVLLEVLYRSGKLLYEGQVECDDQLVISYFKRLCKLHVEFLALEELKGAEANFNTSSSMFREPGPGEDSQLLPCKSLDIGMGLPGMRAKSSSLTREAAIRLAYLILDDSRFGEKNTRQAIEYFQLAASLGSTDAARSLLYLQHTGQY